MNNEFVPKQYVVTEEVLHLVVDDEVDGSMGGVVGEVREVERLIDHPLTSKCCITVKQDGHHLSKCTIHLQSLCHADLKQSAHGKALRDHTL